MRKEVHITPNSDRGGWDVKRPENQRVSFHTNTKAEATVRGKELAKNIGAELIPHGKDGRIQNPNSYGNDSPSVKDTRH